MERLIRVHGKWEGIYENGIGFVSDEACLKWKLFWEDDFSLWHSYLADIDELYLVSTDGCIRLHPTGFTTVLHDVGTLGHDFAFDEIQELKSLCEAVAEECGGTFTMTYSEEKLVNFN